MKSACLLCTFALWSALHGGCVSRSPARQTSFTAEPAADTAVGRLTQENEALREVIRTLKPDAFQEVGLYRIEAGDTGAKIAAKLHMKFSELRALNPGIDWHRLHILQVVRIRPPSANE